MYFVNLYITYYKYFITGLTETIATDLALEKLQGKRSLVISRSTFPGSGSFGGHWTGNLIGYDHAILTIIIVIM